MIYVTYFEQYFIIVLKNCKATKIVMTIDFNKESEIKNIVVKTNREYFEE